MARVAAAIAGIDLTVADLTDETKSQIAKLAKDLDVEFKVNSKSGEVEPYLQNKNLAQAIRTDEAGQAASKVAAIASVRDALFQRQLDFAIPPGLVADGRDMGTIVFKQAPVKIFLTASAECRAKRRFEQLINKGVGANMRALLKSIQARDERDRTRSVAPLVPAVDALVVDSSNLDVQQVLVQVFDFIREKRPALLPD